MNRITKRINIYKHKYIFQQITQNVLYKSSLNNKDNNELYSKQLTELACTIVPN